MTKKALIILVFSTLCVSAIQAQVGKRRNALAIGVNAGYNLNTMDFQPVVNTAQMGGLTGGFNVRYTSEKYLSMICALQVELNFTQLGLKEVTDDHDEWTFERKMNYLQMPILARLGWGKEERGLQFFITLGPQLGLCLGSKDTHCADWDGFLNSRANRKLLPMYDYAYDRRFDYGITGGAGIELNTKVGHFTVEGRYYYGLGDVYNNGKTDMLQRSAHGDIIIKCAYMFDLFHEQIPDSEKKKKKK